MALELNGTTGVSLVQDGVVTAADLASGAITSAALPAGSVLQVQSTIKTDKWTQADSVAQTYYSPTGLSVSITPTSTSSKILIMASVTYCTSNVTYGSLCGLRVARSGNAIGEGGGNFASGTVTGSIADNSSTYATVPIMFLDSPSSTSSLTYQVQIAQRIGGTPNIVVNGDMGGSSVGSSTITVMEIAG